MVIRYSIKELNAIGEMVILKECFNRMESVSITTNNNMNNFQQEFLQFQQQLKSSQNGQTQLDQDSEESSQDQLTSSVAEFFRKAQQNFYAQTNVDPTRVRLLSEVEAELVSRQDSC